MEVLLSRTLSVQPGDLKERSAHVALSFDSEFFQSIESDIWVKASKVTFGSSMRELHAVARGGIASLISRIAPQAAISEKERCASLADWWSDKTVLSYLNPRARANLFGTGAYKSRFLGLVPLKTTQRVLEIGPGPGFMVWLLAAREWNVREAVFVEPMRHFIACGEALWRSSTTRAEFIFAKAEESVWSGRFDVILCSGSILLTEPSARRALFDRFKNSLSPDGVVLLIERLQQPPTATIKCMSLEEVMTLMSVIGKPVVVYHPRNAWANPLDPLTIPVDQYLSNCVFVARSGTSE